MLYVECLLSKNIAVTAIANSNTDFVACTEPGVDSLGSGECNTGLPLRVSLRP